MGKHWVFTITRYVRGCSIGKLDLANMCSEYVDVDENTKKIERKKKWGSTSRCGNEKKKKNVLESGCNKVMKWIWYSITQLGIYLYAFPLAYFIRVLHFYMINQSKGMQ